MILELIVVLAILAIVGFVVGMSILDVVERRQRQTSTLNSEEDSG